MAVLTRSQRPHPVSERPAVPPAAPPTLHLHFHDAEAPDRGGDQRREAPEARLLEHLEAPDAGEGRMGLLEHEFTHGRSQS
jgi:hypothetical protein